MSAESSVCDTPTFRACPRKVLWPRRNEPWSKVEDDRLLKLMAEAVAKQPNVSVYSYKPVSPARSVAEALGRTTCAVQTRYHTLQVCRQRRCSEGET